MKNTMVIAITDAREKCKGEMSLIERVTKAMEATKDHWLVIDDMERFQSAVGATILESPSHEAERLKEEMNGLNHISALMSGINVNIESVPIPENPIGLIGLWAKMNEGRE